MNKWLMFVDINILIQLKHYMIYGTLCGRCSFIIYNFMILQFIQKTILKSQCQMSNIKEKPVLHTRDDRCFT